MEDIDVTAFALKAVRARIAGRIAERTEKVVSASTPLEDVPTHRGEIAALRWLLDELSPKQEVIE